MNCPTCNHKGRVFSSRPKGENVERRYRCIEDDTHPKWITIEQLELVYTPELIREQRADSARKMGNLNIGRGRPRKHKQE